MKTSYSKMELRHRTRFVGHCWTLSLLLAFTAVSSQQQPPSITISPSSGYAAKDQAHQLSCTYISDTSAEVSWYRNGTRILSKFEDPNAKYHFTDLGDLVFIKFTPKDVGQYYCNVTNEFGSAISDNAVLQIPVLKEDFRVSPLSTSAILGTTVKLRCQPPRGTPEPRVQWMRNGTLINIDNEARLSIEYPPGNLIIRNVNLADQAAYVCVGRNEAGECNSESAFLTVPEPPRVIRSPIDAIRSTGQDVTFECVVSGDPTPSIVWTKNDDLLDTGRSQVTANHSLVIYNLNPDDEGSYTCTASNTGGAVEESAHLTVYVAPEFIQRPTTKRAGIGSHVTFHCAVSGNPPPMIFWSREQANPFHIYARQTHDRFSVLEDGSLQIQRVVESDSGVYKCFASNAAGTNTAVANLDVSATANSQPPPIITEKPGNVTVALNHNAELQCKASGDPSPTIRWTHDRRPVLDDSRISINRGSLRISDVMVTDGGEYTCLATSGSGDASASAYLHIIGAQNHVVESLLPSTPQRPAASRDDITTTSVKLYWGAGGESSQDISYTVEIFTLENTQGWVVAATNIRRTSAVIEDLQPGTSYLMLVRASNTHGNSECSPVSDYINTLGQPPSSVASWNPADIQRNLNDTRIRSQYVVVLTSSAINVTWSVAEQKRRFLQGFYVRVSTDGGAAIPIDTIYGSRSNYRIISKLRPYTRYSVTITPFYHLYSGRPSIRLSAVTEQDVPSGPPTRVRVKEGPRYINVTWIPPKISHQNGEITGYMIVCIAEDSRRSKNFSVNATVKNVALDKLNRDTSYRIGVAARTKIGTGVVSDMWRLEARPTPDNEDNVWWKHTVIGAVGGLIWVVICILIICLCRRRRAQKKAQKQKNGDIVTVPLQTTSSPTGLFVQYQLDQAASSQQYPNSSLHPDGINSQNFQLSYNERLSNCIGTEYDEQLNIDNYNDAQFKTFYNKSDSMSTGPYATTVILNNMPERDESLIPRQSPHTTLNGDNIIHGSESSCTDNNGRPGAFSNSSGERASPPVLPSFAEMLPPPPLYPPPPSGPGADNPSVDYQLSPQSVQPGHPSAVGTLPRMGTTQCHTCHRAYHGTAAIGGERPRAHFVVDNQGRLYNPTMPHIHSFTNGRGEYHTTYPSVPRSNSKHMPDQSYNVCLPHGHSSDSHDYAEPHFDSSAEQNLYGGLPPLNPTLVHHQFADPLHQQRLQQQPYNIAGNGQKHPLMHQNSMPFRPQYQEYDSAVARPPPGAAASARHHSLPSSEHSHELCMSCAEQTEYEEPWSDQHWPMLYDPNHAHQLHLHPHHHTKEVARNEEHDENGEEEEDAPMLPTEQASVGSSADDPSQGSHNGQSRSGSEDSKSDRQRQRRRQRAQQLPARSSSPYNGYSTDSSVAFVPRKPYPKSQRKKQMNSKPKSTKSLAVQVEQEEIPHDKV